MAATSIIVTPPTPNDTVGGVLGKVGTATGNFTVTPNDVFTGLVSFSDLSVDNQTTAGGTFTPTSLTFSGSSTPQTFTYTPGKVGRQRIKATTYPTLTKNADSWVITTS